MEPSSTAGGLEGPESMFIMFKSQDNHEFIVKRQYTQASSTIKGMLSGPGRFAENELNYVHFKEIPSHVLSKVFNYFIYKERYTNSTSEIPEYPIPPEVALELLMRYCRPYCGYAMIPAEPWIIPVILIGLVAFGGLIALFVLLLRKYYQVYKTNRRFKRYSFATVDSRQSLPKDASSPDGYSTSKETTRDTPYASRSRPVSAGPIYRLQTPQPSSSSNRSRNGKYTFEPARGPPHYTLKKSETSPSSPGPNLPNTASLFLPKPGYRPVSDVDSVFVRDPTSPNKKKAATNNALDATFSTV